MTTSTETPRDESPAAGEARRVGRGALYLSFSKLYFIVGSYAIYFGLPLVAGGGERGNAVFGDYKAAGSMLSLLSTVLVMGTTQAISRYVGSHPHRVRAIKISGLELQLFVGLVVGAGYFLLIPYIADGDRLITTMRISAGIPICYALYSVFMGALNGERRFGEQAFVDASFTTLKVLLVLGVVLMIPSAEAGYAGFLSAVVLVSLLGAWLSGRGHRDLPRDRALAPPKGELLRFQLQLVSFMFFVQCVVQMDIWYLQWLGGFSEGEAGAAAAVAARALYGNVQLFSQISYSAVIAVTFVLFPLVSAAAAREDPARARAYARQAFRYGLIIVVPLAAALSSVPRATLTLMFLDLPKIYAVLGEGSAEALRYLALGFVAFALFFILCSVLNALGRPRLSLVIAAAVAIVQLGLSAWLTPRYGLVGQAVAGMVSMFGGLIAVVLIMRTLVGSVVPWATALRTLVAGGVVYAIALAWPFEGLSLGQLRMMTLGRVLLSGVVYFAVVIGLREFGRADREQFARVLPGRRRR